MRFLMRFSSHIQTKPAPPSGFFLSSIPGDRFRSPGWMNKTPFKKLITNYLSENRS